MKNLITAICSSACILALANDPSIAQTSITSISEHVIISLPQRESIDIYKATMGSIDATYGKNINRETHDTTYYILLGFQNANSANRTDIQSVYLKSKDEFDELLKDLNSAIQEIGAKTPMDFGRDNYRLYINDFTNELCFAKKPEKGNGYTKLNTINARKLIDWMGTFQFGKG
jgi:hypothetical protein